MTHVIAGVPVAPPVRAPRTTIYPMLRRGRPRKYQAQQITAVDAARLLVAELARRYVAIKAAEPTGDNVRASWALDEALGSAVGLMEVLEART